MLGRTVDIELSKMQSNSESRKDSAGNSRAMVSKRVSPSPMRVNSPVKVGTFTFAEEKSTDRVASMNNLSRQGTGLRKFDKTSKPARLTTIGLTKNRETLKINESKPTCQNVGELEPGIVRSHIEKSLNAIYLDIGNEIKDNFRLHNKLVEFTDEHHGNYKKMGE
jgi:hypothetical protein